MMKLRYAITILLTVLCIATSIMYKAVETPVKNAVAVDQLNGGDVEYVVSQQVLVGDKVLLSVFMGTGGVLILMWIPVIFKKEKNSE